MGGLYNRAPMRAIVRAPSAAYARCLQRAPAPIDVARALDQHAAYVEALRACGLEVTVLPPEPEMADACFVEDVVVMAGDVAVLTRPGAPSRMAEVESVAAAFSRVARMERGRLDGGDVMVAGDVAFVGLSDRTDAEGARELSQWLNVRAMPVPEGWLHLKSGATPLSGQAILARGGEFAGFEVVATEERYGANVLAVGSHVIVSAAAPRTAEMLRRRGFETHVVELSEFHKGDAMVTCLSVITG